MAHRGVAAARPSAALQRPRRVEARAAAASAAGTSALALMLLLACGAAIPAAGALAACPVTPAQTLPFVPDAKTLQASCKDSPGPALGCNLPCLCVFGTTLRRAVESVGKSLSGVDKSILQARARAREAPARARRLRARRTLSLSAACHLRSVFPPLSSHRCTRALHACSAFRTRTTSHAPRAGVQRAPRRLRAWRPDAGASLLPWPRRRAL
jgi:hypothetical protein